MSNFSIFAALLTLLAIRFSGFYFKFLQNSTSKTPKTDLNGVGKSGSASPEVKSPVKGDSLPLDSFPLFSKSTKAIVWGMQTRAVQVICCLTRYLYRFI